MNPTSTEHDFRFPRRPFENAVVGKPDRHAAVPSSSTSSSRTGLGGGGGGGGLADLRASLQEFKLDFSVAYGRAQEKLAATEVFASLRDGAASFTRTPDEMQRDDPLATQVWKFFSKTKQSLPNQERMENMTWRMMHMSLRRRQQAEDRLR